jgi:glycosyltransferase involved in cell wall biosynthesis
MLILNGEESLLFKLCLFQYLVPASHYPIVSVDLILRSPKSFFQRILCRLKGILLKRVQCFVLYHKDVSGYQRYFGIDPNKCLYVPFKVNHLKEIEAFIQNSPDSSNQKDGEYVMAVGRSLRDYGTFVKAMRMTKLPGLVLRQDASLLSQNATCFRYESLPSNIRHVADDGSLSLFLKSLSKARLIVIPRFCYDINATGIATYLQAMAMKKCVIISHGPGTTDLLKNDEAILVPPEDSGTLAAVIEKAWKDRAYRQEIAANGQKYALSLGDEDRLLSDILTVSCRVLKRKKGYS